MIFLVALLAGLFSPTLAVPGMILVYGGLRGIDSDYPIPMLVTAGVGFLLVLASM